MISSDPLPEIETREDILLLIRKFYSKIRKDELLGPIFNATITPESAWEPHLQKLTDFWEGNLFGRTHYTGNPPKAHQELDDNIGNTISGEHFSKWLKIWKATIHELYEGQVAEFAKQRAEGIAFHLLRRIGENRKNPF